ncbi:MAG: M56 family metallopeptidase [Halieaceae bacterium]|uniref:M56 family metallopeptidase n=1 Tax=Haliea alexandrii TaxID=2448162 RepID=UPI001304CA7D|nr:M56 family metallopeptidase [Haliea alexandrii]MCR9185983.1 M56 family metallopeptidase [Halieaceae bacterium]
MNTELLSKAADAVLIWCAVFLFSSLLHALLYPLLQRSCGRVRAAHKASLLLLWGGIPPVAASLATLLVMTPALSAPLIPGHCHGLNCAPHVPVSDAHAALRIGMAAAAGGIGLALLGAMILLAMRLQGQLRTLFALSRSTRSHHYHVVEGAAPAAWCIGWLRPEVYVSRSMLETLPAAELEIVLEHEYAHLRRRDNLRKALLAVVTCLWPRARRRHLHSDFKTATEIACDQAALKATGSADRVASVIAHLDRNAASPSQHIDPQASSDCAQQRIAALRESGQNTQQLPFLLAAIAAIWVLQVCVSTALAHTGIELLH